MPESIPCSLCGIAHGDQPCAFMEKTATAGSVFMVSLLAHRDKTPRVEMTIGTCRVQLEAEAAIRIGKQLIECGEGAYADAFLVTATTEKLDADDGPASQIIQEFR